MKPNSTANLLYHEAADTFAFAMQRLARATEANDERRRDLLQDMHFQLWKSFARFDERCSLKTWVYRVIHNVAASHVNREKRRSVEQVDLSDMNDMPDFFDFRVFVERDDALLRLHEWIRDLKTVDRQVLTLYLEDLSAAEISEIAGLKPGAIATRISRLKNKLALDFKEELK